MKPHLFGPTIEMYHFTAAAGAPVNGFITKLEGVGLRVSIIARPRLPLAAAPKTWKNAMMAPPKMYIGT